MVSLNVINLGRETIEDSNPVVSDGRGRCPAGSKGEFATFGFLSFITTMFSTVVNMG